MDKINKDRESQLAAVAASGDSQAVKRLISVGCDVNAKSADGMTALGVTAFWGYLELADVLLKNGADVTAVNNGSLWTPLHCAAFQGHGPVVMRLLRSQANPEAKDAEGRSAADFASANDAIWPLFAAMGCIRTSKTELISKKIIIKQERSSVSRPGSTTAPSYLSSRPGSAYVMANLHKYNHDTQRASAVLGGDVLANESNVQGPVGRWQFS